MKVPVSVGRKDDPIKVRGVILEVLASIPKILNNPSSEVYFQSDDQMLLSFQIEYYVDLTQTTSRARVDPQLSFAWWKRFAEENIAPPEIAHQLHLNPC
jgi:small-conductance mechanosensitive channel